MGQDASSCSGEIKMLALLQRVTHAQVDVDKTTIGEIKHGLLIFLGVEKQDNEKTAKRLLERILNYRIFSDEQGKMNLNVQQAEGGLLIVPQFTLPADTNKGNRPSFSSAAPPEKGETLYDYFVTLAREQYHTVATGQFGADMQVSLCNDGPVTFMLNCQEI